MAVAVMKTWTEALMKEYLDGTFTRVLYDGKIVTENVEPDFEPYVNRGGRPKGYKAPKPQMLWTAAEDEMLWQMRLRNRPFAEIAWTVNRSEEATKKRYKLLRVKGAVMV